MLAAASFAAAHFFRYQIPLHLHIFFAPYHYLSLHYVRYGRASFGILLLQDLAVVPLLVSIPLLAGAGSGLVRALAMAGVKTVLALTIILFLGKNVLDRLFFLVARARSQEAFLAVILLTVLSMSSLTEGLGLSNTLGAFLAGLMLSETKYRYQVRL